MTLPDTIVLTKEAVAGIRTAKRILILGCGGAGKSTLAKALGNILNLPVTHLDAHFWQSGWAKPDRDQWTETVKRIVAQDSWILDGNYMSDLETRIPSAHQIIYLDFPRYLCLSRVIKRYFQYRGKVRDDMAPGCHERIDWGFIKWIWTFNSRQKPKLLGAISKYGKEKRTVILRSSAEVRFFHELVCASAERNSRND